MTSTPAGRPTDSLGPNTNITTALLHDRCILCAGEDRDEFLKALHACGIPRPARHVRYRSYEFWHFGQCCAILSGIGTGCLEPLLWEIFQPAIIRQIVLVGTAGTLPGSSIAPGQAHLISHAYAAGTGIDREVARQPLGARWHGAMIGPVATSVSTDFYYGFGPHGERAPHGGTYLQADHPLRQAYAGHIQRGTPLVEMEVAQFYFFCDKLGGAGLQFIAVKAASNAVGQETEQLQHTPIALQQTIRCAMGLLQLK